MLLKNPSSEPKDAIFPQALLCMPLREDIPLKISPSSL
jgi:hypothetical protein